MNRTNMDYAFRQTKGPDVALVTNHGYAGVNIPSGGAPDTGGQNIYVNSLARTFAELGYRVTVFTRGGFPHFGTNEIRREPEYLSENIRYVYVPGGGEKFIRKENISYALDEQVEYLDEFIRNEAKHKQCHPWEVYEFINTHYWDAAILGIGLVERWKNDVAAKFLQNQLKGVVSDERLALVNTQRHRIALGGDLEYHFGSMLIGCEGSPVTPVEQRVRAAALRWATVRGLGSHTAKYLAECVDQALSRVQKSMAKVLCPIVAADALGKAMFALFPNIADSTRLEMERVNRHVWTPHSLGVLKDENFFNASRKVRRKLRFCERRSHERMVCAHTRAYTATSVKIAERLHTHFNVPAEKIFYFPPCIDRKVFRSYPPEDTACAWQYLSRLSKIDENKLRASKIVFETSRMDQTKRKDLLLDAFARVISRCPDAYLFIGGGPENDIFNSLKNQLESDSALREHAFLTGFIPDKYIGPLFSIARVYVSTSEMEGFGMSVSQAAAASTALVCSDHIPFCAQYVPDEALIVPAGDVEDFENAMYRLLSDNHECAQRANRLAERVQVLDWKVQIQLFLEYLHKRNVLNLTKWSDK